MYGISYVSFNFRDLYCDFRGLKFVAGLFAALRCERKICVDSKIFNNFNFF